MSYILKQYDTDLLHFDMQKDIDGVSVQILSVKGGQTQQDTQKAVSNYIPAYAECTVTFASETE